MTHALFSPSSAYRWMKCTKSLTLPKVKERTNDHAIRGTALHSLAEDIINEAPVKMFYGDGFYSPTWEDYVRVVLPYCEYVHDLNCDTYFVEQKVHLNDLCYGTVDYLGYIEEEKTLHVVDLKCGSGYVSASNNSQLMIYAIGAIDFMKSMDKKVEKIFAHIFQPARGKPRSTELFKKDLKVFRDEVLEIVSLVRNDTTSFYSDDKVCRWCDHKNTCPEMVKVAVNRAKEDFSGLDDI